MLTPTYDVHYAVQAAAARDQLDDEQRATFDKGIALLAHDPFPPVSRPRGSAGDNRTVRLTRNSLVEYAVGRGRLLILAVAVFDDKDVLIPEA
ncbi:hypothetical protein [Streptomyces tailanensis]|uniref:hypothetical protein n=1 Tax=Streptomyces tailanensis TaxID=2569858 RepID=UPI00122E0EB7|nr:hypothetical protein [Streptomyces tailanensis]